MAYGVFDEVRDASPEGLAALNDHLRYLYSRVQGNLGLKELAGDATGALDAKADAETVELQELDVLDHGAALEPAALKLAVGQIGGGNLLKNSDFTFYGKNWTAVPASPSPIETETGRVAAGMARITGDAAAARYVLQEVEFPTAARMVASCWALANGLTPAEDGFAGLRVEAVGSDGAVHALASDSLTGTADWRRLQVNIDPAGWPEGGQAVARVRVYGWVERCTGTAAFDDFQLEEGDNPTAWTPNAAELKNSSMTITDDAVAIDTHDFSLTLRDDSNDAALQMSADSLGWNSVVVKGDLTLSGRVIAGEKCNIDTYQGRRTMYVGTQYGTPGNPDLSQADDGVWPDPSYFSSFSSAIDSMGRRLTDGLTTINVQAGTYGETMTVEGFFGRGSLAIYLKGGASAAERAVFTGGAVIQYNAVPVSVYATDNAAQSNNGLMPLLKGSGGTRGLLVNCNASYVYVGGVCMQAGDSSHAVFCTGNSDVNFRYCCMEKAGSGYAGLALVYGAAYIYNCTGTNGGFGCQVSDGGHLIRRATVPNGSTALSNVAGAVHDFGTVTPTNSATTPPAPPAQYTEQYPCTASRSWRTVYSGWRDETVNLYQGSYQGYGTHKGCFLFGGATELAGKTILSARLYLKRTGSGGSSGAQPVKLYATTNITAIPASGATPEPALAGGTPNGMTVLNLAWNAGGWADIPVYFAQQAAAGRALCLYSGTANYAILYGNGSAYEPILEVKYQ